MSRRPSRLERWIGCLAIAALLVGCATIIDSIRVEPLSATPFHQNLTTKPQCMHCHSQLDNAPAVPHTHYKKCAQCHVAAH